MLVFDSISLQSVLGFRGSTPDPAGGRTAPPNPPAGSFAAYGSSQK